MYESLMVTGAIAAVAVTATVVSAPALTVKHEAPQTIPSSTVVPSAPVIVPPISAPPAPPVASPVPPPSVVPVSPPAATTAPVRPTPTPPGDSKVGESPMLPPPTESSDSEPTTTTGQREPCDIGFVLDPVLGICVRI